jgi:hypothetical protein
VRLPATLIETLFLVSETHRNTGDGGDVRRKAHNPEVEGSNPSPAMKMQVRSSSWTGKGL